MNQLENVEAFYRWSKVILANQCNLQKFVPLLGNGKILIKK